LSVTKRAAAMRQDKFRVEQLDAVCHRGVMGRGCAEVKRAMRGGGDARRL
jgi:hypothetical protein